MDVHYVLTELYCYPVKSCRGIALEEAQLDEYGIKHDREWMIVDGNGRFLTQRQHPRMALIEPALTPQALQLSAPGVETITVPSELSDAREEKARLRQVRVWHDDVWAVDEGDEVATWLSEFLGVECRLVRRGQAFHRPVDPRYAVAGEHDQVGFADGFPLLLTSQASLDDLNARLPEPVAMERFRPNLVVTDCEPYEEDRWTELQIGDLTLHVVKPCSRCTIPTVDPRMGERDPNGEPLRTLATYRRNPDGKVHFGQNLIHKPKWGALRVGDEVIVLQQLGSQARQRSERAE
jgi:hypothetical protein